MPEKCARCGADKMMEDVRLNTDPTCLRDSRTNLPASGRLVAYVHTDPGAWVFKGTAFGELRARVCGGCGYTELHTTNFKELYQAYQQSRSG
jgi:hypothetical protein